MYPLSGCLLWACRSHLTQGVLQHVFGNQNASYKNPFIQLYKIPHVTRGHGGDV